MQALNHTASVIGTVTFYGH